MLKGALPKIKKVCRWSPHFRPSCWQAELAGDELVVVVVRRRSVRGRQGRHVGRARHAVGRAAVHLDADREGSGRTAVPLVHDVNLVACLLHDDAPVGPAAAAVGVVGGKEHPVLAVGRRSEGLLHDDVVGARTRQAPNAHRLVWECLALGERRPWYTEAGRGRRGVKGQDPRGAHFVVGHRGAVESQG